MTTQAILLGEFGNYALVERSSRAFPGLLIQGDTLLSLRETVEDLSRELENGEFEDARYSVLEIREAIGDFVRCYEHLMGQSGRPSPYPPQDKR